MSERETQIRIATLDEAIAMAEATAHEFQHNGLSAKVVANRLRMIQEREKEQREAA